MVGLGTSHKQWFAKVLSVDERESDDRPTLLVPFFFLWCLGDEASGRDVVVRWCIERGEGDLSVVK